MTLRPLPPALLFALTLAPAIARSDVPPPSGGIGGLSAGGCSVEREEQRLGEACELCSLEPTEGQGQSSCAARFEGTDFVFACSVSRAAQEVWCEEGGGCSYAPPRDAAPPLGVAASGLAAAAVWLIRRRRRPAG